MSAPLPTPRSPHGPGIHFTPEPLARALVRAVLTPGSGPRRLLDPACGDGSLLLAAWHEGASLGLAAGDLFGIELDPGLANRARQRLRAEIPGAEGERAARGVRTGDALDGRPWPRGTRIAANPPWVSYSGRQASARPSAGPSSAGWPSLHGAFLVRIAEHAAQERAPAVLLLPASVCELSGYGPVRREVTRWTRLAGPPRDLGESAFPGVVEPAVELALEPLERASAGSEAPWSLLTPETSTLLSALDALPRLPPISYGDIGVHTGNCSRELVVRRLDGSLPALREGRDLGPYRLGSPRHSLNVRLQRTPKRRFRVAERTRYAGVPVLLRQTAARPTAALHLEPTYFRNSLLACFPPPELDPAFVVAVLNSSVVGAAHHVRYRDARQRTFPQVKISHLRETSFPITARREAPRLHDAIATDARRLQAAGGQDATLRARIEVRLVEAFGLTAELLDTVRPT